MPKKKREYLAFSNRYMFGRVMLNETICKGVIETVLGIRPTRIEYLNSEQVLEVDPQSRGIRMDVYVESDNEVFDIEMQVYSESVLGRRMRYYQSTIDANLLGKSENYRVLPESYIVFLCVDDPFGMGHPVYTFERSCTEDSTIDIACGSHWRVLNASAWASEHSERLRHLLRYVCNGKVNDDPLVKAIDTEVAMVNKDDVWLDNIWSVSTLQNEHKMELNHWKRIAHKAKQQGIEQGIEQGEERSGRLVDALLDAGRFDDLKRQCNDPSYRQTLFEEFGL